MFEIPKIITDAEAELKSDFKRLDEISLYNQDKVLSAFRKNQIAARHFAGTSGYGYDDIGRDTLSKVFADVFRAEAAIVSPYFSSGTHTISTALFGVLRPGDKLLCATGNPYDTLQGVIFGQGTGSLKDFFIEAEIIPLKQGLPDLKLIEKTLSKDKNIKSVFIGRSRGYEWRDALSTEDIKTLCKVIKGINPDICIITDNCYGEFVDVSEPVEAGSDIAAGSLIKNPGGGLAPGGGYIVGVKKYVDLIANRLTAPGVGFETGSYMYGYQQFYQGLFFAPHVVSCALKGSLLFGRVFKKLGFDTLPDAGKKCGDIITSIKFNTSEQLIAFIRAIQNASPVDGHVVPYPWDMPGYESQVIMAAGTFVQGASIELSADSPIREPYIAYLQGGLTYEHVKIALKNCLEALNLQ